jgi:hypothetical protein
VEEHAIRVLRLHPPMILLLLLLALTFRVLPVLVPTTANARALPRLTLGGDELLNAATKADVMVVVVAIVTAITSTRTEQR